jgi:hypothetical protein
MTEIKIEYSSEFDNYFKEILKNYPHILARGGLGENRCGLINAPLGFCNAVQLSQLLVTLTPALIPAIASIIIALINRQSSFKLRVKTNEGEELEIEAQGLEMEHLRDVWENVLKKIAKDTNVHDLMTAVSNGLKMGVNLS